MDPRATIRRTLEASVLDGAAHTAPSLRRAVAAQSDALPDELRALVAKIHAHAYRVTDEEVAALAGRYSDDERFEIVVAGSIGAAFSRLDRALALLGDE